MLRKIGSITLIVGLLISAASIAQTPASAPAGSTGLCKDGSYWSGTVKKGACHGHEGVQDWYGAPTASAPGGSRQVWVNTSTKVYHCPSDRWYGKTKNGTYMNEAQAAAQGNRLDHGKACQ